MRKPPPIEPGLRFKYSNLGFGLLGLVIEAVTQQSYAAWIANEILVPAGLPETTADIVRPDHRLFARGHSAQLPLGHRLVIPGDNETDAFAPVTGFVSTAADLARFFAQLSPNAPASILSPEARREMTRAHRPDRDSLLGRAYGLGVHSGRLLGWDYFGHVGLFQGFVTRTAVLPEIGVTIAVLTNAIDGPAEPWLDAIVHILWRFHHDGAPAAEYADWLGRWWSMFGPVDFVPLGAKILAVNPAFHPPFAEASEITLTDRDHGLVTRAPGIARFAEPVWRVRNQDGAVAAIRMGDAGFVSEEALKQRLSAQYERPVLQAGRRPEANGTA